jgi:hypothetical protein
MGDKVASLAGKRVIVISDNDGLTQAMALDLSHCLKLQTISLTSGSSERSRVQVERNSFDLIVVVTSSPTSEPVVMLGRALLAQQIGCVPLLIVSDRPFDPDMDNQFFHLNFPIKADQLLHKVAEILRMRSESCYICKEPV